LYMQSENVTRQIYMCECNLTECTCGLTTEENVALYLCECVSCGKLNIMSEKEIAHNECEHKNEFIYLH